MGCQENMVTKHELKEELGKLRSDMIDFIDKKLLDLKGDLVVFMLDPFHQTS